MRIAFADFTGWDFHARSVDIMPMGGAQSAACYLARALAHDGHEVFLLGGCSAPGRHDGVTCLSWGHMSVDTLSSLELDAVVDLLSAENGPPLRAIAGPDPLLILWNQHAHDQPSVQLLCDAPHRSVFDGFAMVSDWQLEQFQQRFGIERRRMTVMRNAIAPAFADLFSDQEPILTQKTSPPTLAYSSTPFRGLRLLLDAFPHIRQAVPGARLRVFSSMKVYLKSAEEDEAAYGALYQRCREMEGVEYIGSLPQAELARELRSAAILAYPNTFAETSCINVMEAMAAGCTVITSRLAALPETGAGYARLIAVEEGEEAYLHGFITETIHALRSFTAREPALELELGRQVAAMNQTATWPVRAREWIRWLETLAVERRAASATSQALALAFQHHQAGRLQAAENIYRQILQTNPTQPDALNLLGLVAHATGQHGTAIQLIGQAVASEPTAPQFHYNLAKIYRALDRLPDAIACYQRTLALKPDFAAAHHNLGNAFRAQGNLAEAAACYRRALEIKADFPQAAHNLRLALETLERKV